MNLHDATAAYSAEIADKLNSVNSDAADHAAITQISGGDWAASLWATFIIDNQ